MANRNSSRNSRQSEEREFFDIKGMRVSNVRKIPGTDVISFSLLGKGLGLYNLRVVKGANGEFIGEPATKGRDGAFYKVYALYLSDEDQKRIIGVVRDKLPTEEVKPEDVDF